jgi:enoyl-[acyl-carrier-protein] reductase (NADH)
LRIGLRAQGATADLRALLGEYGVQEEAERLAKNGVCSIEDVPCMAMEDVEKFKLSSKYDSLDLMNLSIAFEENFQQQGKYIDFSKKNLKKVFKDYKSIYNFLENNEKKN